MKSLVVCIGLFISISVYSQNIDWVNAPVNPIAFKYKLEHFNLKGDVYAFGKQLFSKDGFMIFENQFSTHSFLYKNNQLYADTSGKLYEFNNQGYLSKMTYASSGVHTQTYSYNTEGLLIKVTNTKGYNAVYDYDSSNRLIKSNIGGSIKEYSYKKNSDELIITEKDYYKSPMKQTILIYKNGHWIGKDDNRFNNRYDTFGNLILSKKGDTLFYSDIENKANEISVVYEKATYPTSNFINECKFYINSKRVEFLFAKVLNRKDLMIYDPFKEKYLIVEDAFDDTKSGKTQIFSKIYINTHSYLDMSESFEQMCYKGTLLTNAIYLRKNSLKVYNQFSNYICYDEFIDKTLFCKFNPNEKFSFYPLEELDSKENLFLIKDNSSIIYAEKGKVLPGSDYTFAYHNKDIVLYKNNQPTYCFPNCKNANSETVYPGRTYNSKTDSYTAEKSSSVSNSSTNYKDNSTTTETSCISGNCTDGFGVLKTSTSTITGFFAAGKANGYGKEVYDDGSGHYEGKFGSGVRSGFGLYYWNSTQQYYIGEWKHGKQYGYGYYKKGGEIFQAGYYENGKQVRNMLTQNFINKKAVGNCIGNCYDGFGFYQFPNNDKYVGFFKNGKKDYVGAYTWATGDAYIGGLLLGSLSGQAMLFYKSTGTTYYGNISNGIRQGMGAYFNKSGDIESKGFWDNGVLKRAL